MSCGGIPREGGGLGAGYDVVRAFLRYSEVGRGLGTEYERVSCVLET